MSAVSVFPDADYLILSSRLIPDLDGGYTIATLARARQMAAAGVESGLGPQLLTFDPGTAAEHAEHRAVFAARGALTAPERLRNLFDEAVAPGGGAAEWVRAALTDAVPAAGTADDDRVLTDADGLPFLSLPVIAGNPDWHLSTAAVRVYDAAGTVIGELAGFGALYLAWLKKVAAETERTMVVICESRQLGELIASWDDPRVRIIHTIHTMHLEPPFDIDGPMNPLWTRWFALCERFDAVAWPTRSQRADVVARFGESDVHVLVSNGIVPPAASAVEREPGLVVALGRLAPGKRVDHAIRAFVAADVPGTRLEIWGGGAEQQRLQRLIDDLDAGDRVRLAGFTTDPGSVLDRASLLVTATLYEGQPLSIVEALSHGCPVVSYDVRYGLRDILTDGGGVLVPAGDEQALSDALRRVLSDAGQHERLLAEARPAAAPWDDQAAMRSLAAVARAVVSRPSRRA
ncbi:glycosyltransferase [uncultured Microbacterium sp.]|uniref:glycosyltransferase n=1 Tax=uncultured Microbacterium sp. TaxID=191216 RepID=UPI0026359712|nr:glycosyltransferase [uncultured Microbacterium sp.]